MVGTVGEDAEGCGRKTMEGKDDEGCGRTMEGKDDGGCGSRRQWTGLRCAARSDNTRNDRATCIIPRTVSQLT